MSPPLPRDVYSSRVYPPFSDPFSLSTTSPPPTPCVPPDTTNPHPPQKIAARGSQNTRSPNAINTAHPPSPKPLNKPEPTMHTAPGRGRGRRPRHRTRTCTFLPLADYFFHTSPKNPDYIYTLSRRPVFSDLFVSATHFLDVSYSLHFRIPIPYIIFINSLYTLSLVSGIP